MFSNDGFECFVYVCSSLSLSVGEAGGQGRASAALAARSRNRRQIPWPKQQHSSTDRAAPQQPGPRMAEHVLQRAQWETQQRRECAVERAHVGSSHSRRQHPPTKTPRGACNTVKSTEHKTMNPFSFISHVNSFYGRHCNRRKVNSYLRVRVPI